jgi:hypothetical protein
MIKRILIALVLVILTLPVFTASALPLDEIWETLTATDDVQYEIYGDIWFAQTFTTSTESHSISSIRIKMYRELLPGTLIASIKATSAGLPTGADLTSGSINGSVISTDAAGIWYEIPITEYSLNASTCYAIVLKALSGDVSNSIHLRYDGSAGALANGSEINSTDAGITWAADADDDLLFSVYGKHLISIEGANVFRNYLQTDDMLIVLSYFNQYTPYYPDSDVEVYFNLQLRNAAGTVIIAQNPVRAWGYKAGAIYLNASSCSALTSGTAYRIYVSIFGDAVSSYYTLTAADWRGSDLAYLDSWVRLQAHAFESYYSETFTISVAGQGDVLNAEGNVIFTTGIPALASVRPDLFEVALITPEYDAETWVDTWGATTWQDQVGATLETILDDTGFFLGVDGKAIGGFGLLICWIAVAMLIVGKGGKPSLALFIAIPFVIIGTYFRLIDYQITAIVTAILVIIALLSIWVTRTG